MSTEIKTKVTKMIYNISTENRAAANRDLKEILDLKVKKSLSREYEKVKASFSKENS